jgi:hypothetical protein
VRGINYLPDFILPMIINENHRIENEIQSPDYHPVFDIDPCGGIATTEFEQQSICICHYIGKGTHTIPLPFMTSGMYLLRFNKEGEFFTEKLIKT